MKPEENNLSYYNMVLEYQEKERKRLHDIIENKKLTRNTADSLHELVDEFLTKNYRGISQNERWKLHYSLKERISYKKVFSPVSKIEESEFDDITEQLEICFNTFLDQSVEKQKKDSLFDEIKFYLRDFNFLNFNFLKK
ncbi:hypothetical protein Metev_0161 [Methanohalobium evestigatum Z-7303]|uniref:Uncharacterized protein n=1 Tax=Methanohalobium evestigatum (strain ATCC BAA-1072 / DSM 3721 / NBRC 107634 / OCM 161 / Z-7303) TaxID=644295 RepID=D7E670_METEZ|nr:hypothetical protein [Methanohalobium evestigatum]ADI73092.1 hypothetical protein Metev_0161 [Methanohalobium evestigatum Z-7303]